MILAEIDEISSNYVRDLFKQQTARDKQRTVGLSQLSNLCSKCLAETMATGANHQSKFDAGAVIGTAIHEMLERRNNDPMALKEFKGLVDVIPDYGEIRSTTDLYRIDNRQIIDFKTSTRAKMDVYLRDWEKERPNSTLDRYWRQAQGYAYMVEGDVDTVTICFIARDAQIIDRDIFALSMPYDERIAVGMMNRAKSIWKYLEDGGDWRELNSHEDCFVCNNVRPILESEEVDDL